MVPFLYGSSCHFRTKIPENSRFHTHPESNRRRKLYPFCRELTPFLYGSSEVPYIFGRFLCRTASPLVPFLYGSSTENRRTLFHFCMEVHKENPGNMAFPGTSNKKEDFVCLNKRICFVMTYQVFTYPRSFMPSLVFLV